MSNLETKDYTEYTQEGENFALIGKNKQELGLLQNIINQIEQKETKEDLELRKLTNLYLDVLGGDISKKDALIQQIIKTYSSFHKMEEKDFPVYLKKYLENNFNPSNLGKEESISLRALLINNGNPTIRFCDNSKTIFGHQHYDPRDNTVNLPIECSIIGTIGTIIAEVAHAKQAKIRGDNTASMATRQVSDYIQHRKKDVYKQPGTLEYEAHTIIEPQLQREYSLNILNQVKNRKNLSPEKIEAIINASYIPKNNKDCEAMQKEFLASFKEFYKNNKKAIDTHGDIDTIIITLHHFDPIYINDMRKIQYEIHGVSLATFDLCASELEISKTFKIYDMAKALSILFAKDTSMVSDKISSHQNNPFINDQVVKKATDYLRKNIENIKNMPKKERIEIFQILSPSENQKKMIHAYGLGWVFEGFDKDDMNFLMPQG